MHDIVKGSDFQAEVMWELGPLNKIFGSFYESPELTFTIRVQRGSEKLKELMYLIQKWKEPKPKPKPKKRKKRNGNVHRRTRKG